jgi:hypothetical protein
VRELVDSINDEVDRVRLRLSIMTFGGLAGGFAKQLTLAINEKNPQTPIRSSRIWGNSISGLLLN